MLSETYSKNSTTDPYLDSVFSPRTTRIVNGLFVTVAALGIIGNTLIIYGIVRKIVSNTAFVVLLLHLAITDLTMDILILPCMFLDTRSYIKSPERIQRIICGVVSSGTPFWMAVAANTIILAYISFVRSSSMLIHYNQFQSVILKKRNIAFVITFTWITVVGLSVPSYTSHSIDPQTGHCRPDSKTYNLVYNVILVFLFWSLPMLCLVSNLVIVLRHVLKNRSSNQSVVIQQQRRITTLLLVLMTTYMVFWAPTIIYFLMRVTNHKKFNHTFQGKLAIEKIRRPVMLVGLLNTLSDPILYAFMWSSFRQGFSKHFTHAMQKAYPTTVFYIPRHLRPGNSNVDREGLHLQPTLSTNSTSCLFCDTLQLPYSRSTLETKL